MQSITRKTNQTVSFIFHPGILAWETSVGRWGQGGNGHQGRHRPRQGPGGGHAAGQAGHGPAAPGVPGADEHQAGPGHRDFHLQQTAGGWRGQVRRRRIRTTLSHTKLDVLMLLSRSVLRPFQWWDCTLNNKLIDWLKTENEKKVKHDFILCTWFMFSSSLHYRIGQQAVVNIQTVPNKCKYSKEITILR